MGRIADTQHAGAGAGLCRLVKAHTRQVALDAAVSLIALRGRTATEPGKEPKLGDQTADKSRRRTRCINWARVSLTPRTSAVPRSHIPWHLIDKKRALAAMPLSPNAAGPYTELKRRNTTPRKLLHPQRPIVTGNFARCCAQFSI